VRTVGAEGKEQMTERKTAAFSRVFALEVDGKPALAFEARNVPQAQELCKESWLRDDLASLKSVASRFTQHSLSSRCDQPPLKRQPFSAKLPKWQNRLMIWCWLIWSNWTADSAHSS
jgi:hypothetical protein